MKASGFTNNLPACHDMRATYLVALTIEPNTLIHFLLFSFSVHRSVIQHRVKEYRFVIQILAYCYAITYNYFVLFSGFVEKNFLS